MESTHFETNIDTSKEKIESVYDHSNILSHYHHEEEAPNVSLSHNDHPLNDSSDSAPSE
jgi:hypothetical protein